MAGALTPSRATVRIGLRPLAVGGKLVEPYDLCRRLFVYAALDGPIPGRPPDLEAARAPVVEVRIPLVYHLFAGIIGRQGRWAGMRVYDALYGVHMHPDLEACAVKIDPEDPENIRVLREFCAGLPRATRRRMLGCQYRRMFELPLPIYSRWASWLLTAPVPIQPAYSWTALAAAVVADPPTLLYPGFGLQISMTKTMVLRRTGVQYDVMPAWLAIANTWFCGQMLPAVCWAIAHRTAGATRAAQEKATAEQVIARCQEMGLDFTDPVSIPAG